MTQPVGDSEHDEARRTWNGVTDASNRDDGVLVDRSATTTEQVDAAARRAGVGDAADRAGFGTAPRGHGLAHAGGLVSVSELSRFTLGGGIGQLDRAGQRGRRRRALMRAAGRRRQLPPLDVA